MQDRDGYWIARLYELIADCPGICMTMISQRSKRLTTRERRGYLERLLAAGRIRWDEVTDDGGNVTWCFWPKHPAGEPDALAAARAALRDARQHFTAGLDQIDAALQLLDASPVVSQVGDGPTVELADSQGIELATTPEGETRGAVYGRA